MEIQPEKPQPRARWVTPLVTSMLINCTQSGTDEVFEDVDGDGFFGPS